MIIQVEKIIPKEELSKISHKVIGVLNEAINKDFDLHVKKIEDETAEKFNNLVESLTSKFNEQVDKVLCESVKNNFGEKVNQKFFTIVKGIANLLESAGIDITEKTKELHQKLDMNNNVLEKTMKERDAILNKLNDSEKENFITRQLSGMHPNVIGKALEYFKNKDIMDVQDEIQAFIDEDFTKLDLSQADSQFIGELNIDQVRDALSEIDTQKKDRDEKNPVKSKFESLGRGLRVLRVTNSPDVSKEEMNEASEQVILENQYGNLESDAKEAMEKISEFNNIGRNFR